MRKLFEALAHPLPAPCRGTADGAFSATPCAKISCILALALAGAGCVADPMPDPMRPSAAKVPRPSASLMASEPAPLCEYAETGTLPQAASTGNAPAEPPIQASLSAEAAQRRERERDCYRDAEYRVRSKLSRLQSSVRTTLKAVDKYDGEIR